MLYKLLGLRPCPECRHQLLRGLVCSCADGFELAFAYSSLPCMELCFA